MTFLHLNGLMSKEMRSEIKNEIRTCIREIERLLGPSFPLKTFALALIDEMRLKGIKGQLSETGEDHLMIETGSVSILIEDNLSAVIRLNEDDPVACWIPHKYLIFPELSGAVA